MNSRQRRNKKRKLAKNINKAIIRALSGEVHRFTSSMSKKERELKFNKLFGW